MSEQATATFDFGERLGNDHLIGNADCDEGWCGGHGYPKPCENLTREGAGVCAGLIHANWGDENFNGDYWIYTKCDVCGEPE